MCWKALDFFQHKCQVFKGVGHIMFCLQSIIHLKPSLRKWEENVLSLHLLDRQVFVSLPVKPIMRRVGNHLAFRRGLLVRPNLGE